MSDPVGGHEEERQEGYHGFSDKPRAQRAAIVLRISMWLPLAGCAAAGGALTGGVWSIILWVIAALCGALFVVNALVSVVFSQLIRRTVGSDEPPDI